MNLPEYFSLSDEVVDALQSRKPVVALESTVITHGLPYEQNVELAMDLEQIVRDRDAVPATVALLNGMIQVGLNESDLEFLGGNPGLSKVSSRDIGIMVAKKLSGGTTVAATSLIASKVGIHVFATGGIGGVHRRLSDAGSPLDISADLPQLAITPIIVVCAGAKAILDLPATVEYLETWSIPVLGYQTDEFPAFYSRSSGLPVSVRVEMPREVVDIAIVHWQFIKQGAILVTNPVPEDVATSAADMDRIIQQALKEARSQDIQGQQVTPFLLNRVSQLSHGRSLRANLALLRNNASLAAEVAIELTSRNLLS